MEDRDSRRKLSQELIRMLGEGVNFYLCDDGRVLHVFGGGLTGDKRCFRQEDYWVFHKQERAGSLRCIYEGSTNELVVLHLEIYGETPLSVNGKKWYSGRNFEQQKTWTSRDDFIIPQVA